MLAKRFVAVKNENKARLKRPISKNLEKKSHSAEKSAVLSIFAYEKYLVQCEIRTLDLLLLRPRHQAQE